MKFNKFTSLHAHPTLRSNTFSINIGVKQIFIVKWKLSKKLKSPQKSRPKILVFLLNSKNLKKKQKIIKNIKIKEMKTKKLLRKTKILEIS